MKILMLLENSYLPDIRVEKEIRTLTAAGHEVTLACVIRKEELNLPEHASWQESSLKLEKKTYCCQKNSKLTIYRRLLPTLIYKASVGALKFPLYFNFWRSYLSKILSEHSFDAVHVHDLPLAGIASEIRAEKGIPFILDLHENYPFLLKNSPHTQTFAGKLLSSHEQWLKYEEQMLKEADIILSVVEEQRDRLTALGTDPQKIYIVPNTPVLDNQELPEMPEEKNNYVFIYAGSFGASRDFTTLFRAFKELIREEPSARLWLVGNGKNSLQLKKLQKQLSLKQQVTFFGWQPHQKMLSLIAQSDAAILPLHKNENNDNSSPNKLFQYMMLGKPVIASNCKSIVRIIEEYQAGLIYEDTNITSLKSKMLYALKFPSIMKKLGNNGRKLILTKYNWNNTAENLLKAYESLTN